MEQSVQNISNVEAILNIFGNVAEIAGIRNGMMLICASVLVLFTGQRANSAKYALIAIALAAAGCLAAVAVPPLHHAVGDNGALAVVAAITCGVLAFLIFVASMALIALPTLIARRRGAKRYKAITILCFAGLLVPLLWSIAVLMAHRLKADI